MSFDSHKILQNNSESDLNASDMDFTSKLRFKITKHIIQSMKPNCVVYFHKCIGFVGQPSGENEFSK